MKPIHLCKAFGLQLLTLVIGNLNYKWMIVDVLESRTDMTENHFCFLNLSLRSNQELSLKKGPSMINSILAFYCNILTLFHFINAVAYKD